MVALAARRRAHAGARPRRAAHPAAVRQFRDGRLRASRGRRCERRRDAEARRRIRGRPRLRGRGSAPARPCASSPARRAGRRRRDRDPGGRHARDGDRVTLARRCRRRGDNVRHAGIDFAEGEPLLQAGTRLGAARRRARRRREPRARCPAGASRASRSWRPATNSCRPASRSGPPRSSPPTICCVLGLAEAAGGEAIDLGIAARRPRRAGRFDPARHGGQGRRAGDARRRLGRRPRPRPAGARRRRHGARLLEDRHAAGQAADARPPRRHARARPAGQSGFVGRLRRAVPTPAAARAAGRPGGGRST